MRGLRPKIGLGAVFAVLVAGCAQTSGPRDFAACLQHPAVMETFTSKAPPRWLTGGAAQSGSLYCIVDSGLDRAGSGYLACQRAGLDNCVALLRQGIIGSYSYNHDGREYFGGALPNIILIDMDGVKTPYDVAMEKYLNSLVMQSGRTLGYAIGGALR